MVDSNRRRLIGFAGGAVALGTLPRAYSQDKFPSKPIEVVTHSGVGGGTDITARMMMVHAPGVFKTEFVVVNRTGGSGAAALDYLLERKDGHTIALVTQTHLLTILRSKGKYKYEDLVPLARATEDPQVLMVGKNSPYKTPADFFKAAKGKAMKFGTTHVGSIDHIGTVAVARAAGLQPPSIVPFRGGADVVINLVGGNIDAALANYAESESQVKSGDVRPLVTFANSRLSVLPNVPTGKEVGVDTIQSTVRGFVTVRGVPQDRIKALEDGLVKAMQGQMFQSYLETSGQAKDSVVGAGPWKAQLDAFMNEGKQTLESLGLLK